MGRSVRILAPLVVALFFGAGTARTAPIPAGDQITHQRTEYLDFLNVFYVDRATSDDVFEPASLLLLGSGLCLIAARMRRQSRQKPADASKS